jgi:hypothetical protein
VEWRTIRKAMARRGHLLLLVFITYSLAYLDRANLSPFVTNSVWYQGMKFPDTKMKIPCSLERLIVN